MIHLIRHASAGRRSAALDDGERPLDEVGLAQALRIAETLGSTDIDIVASSGALRCRQTVGPLAESLGLCVEPSESLYEGQGGHDALALVHRLVEAGSAAALCSHGDVIPHLLDLLAAAGIDIVGNGCAKGSIWTLSVRNGAIVRATYTANP